MSSENERGQQASNLPWHQVSSRARTPRTQGTRERAMRVQSWTPPATLPDPHPRDGLVHRWIRISALNSKDDLNANRQLTSGWTPCLAQDYPEIFMDTDATDSRYAAQGAIITGGLMLCCMPERVAEERAAYYQKQNDDQMRGIESHYLREEDSRMPLLKPEGSVGTTFG